MTKRLRPGCSGFAGSRCVILARVVLLLVTPLPLGFGWPAAAAAAELDGVTMPDYRQVGGQKLLLNGIGVRTYSIFRIHIYVAGLYLEQQMKDGRAVLASSTVKLLVIRFVHDVTADQGRDAWAQALELNCSNPCRIRGEDKLRFLSLVPAFHRGDESTLLFRDNTAEIKLNDRLIGTVTNPDFARTILATFIGDYPPNAPFKHALLGQPDD